MFNIYFIFSTLKILFEKIYSNPLGRIAANGLLYAIFGLAFILMHLAILRSQIFGTETRAKMLFAWDRFRWKYFGRTMYSLVSLIFLNLIDTKLKIHLETKWAKTVAIFIHLTAYVTWLYCTERSNKISNK